MSLTSLFLELPVAERTRSPATTGSSPAPRRSRRARNRWAARRSSISRTGRRRWWASCSAARGSAVSASSTSRSRTCGPPPPRCTLRRPTARSAPVRAPLRRTPDRDRRGLVRRRARVRPRGRPNEHHGPRGPGRRDAGRVRRAVARRAASTPQGPLAPTERAPRTSRSWPTRSRTRSTSCGAPRGLDAVRPAGSPHEPEPGPRRIIGSFPQPHAGSAPMTPRRRRSTVGR